MHLWGFELSKYPGAARMAVDAQRLESGVLGDRLLKSPISTADNLLIYSEVSPRSSHAVNTAVLVLDPNK
jgi:hypothetical protein